jgi:hypothetical protein
MLRLPAIPCSLHEAHPFRPAGNDARRTRRLTNPAAKDPAAIIHGNLVGPACPATGKHGLEPWAVPGCGANTIRGIGLKETSAYGCLPTGVGVYSLRKYVDLKYQFAKKNFAPYNPVCRMAI